MKKRKFIIMILIGISIVGMMAGLVIAKYIGSSNELGNHFETAEYDTPTINETVSTDTDDFQYKTNVSVTAQDHGYPVYVRVEFVITWQDENGIVLGVTPVLGTDYTLAYNSTNWEYNSDDGYYYYKTALASGATTAPLIATGQKLKQVKAAPAGYDMNVEILAQTIQAVGSTDRDVNITAVYDAWGVQPDREEGSD